MLIETLAQDFRKARITNTTDSSYPTRAPQLAKPKGTGNAVGQTTSAVFESRGTGEYVQNSILIVPYGNGSNDNTGFMRLISWRPVQDPLQVQGQADKVWIPVPLFDVEYTLGAQTGVTGGTISTEFFADTISITGTTANQGVSIDVVSPANDTIAYLVVDIRGTTLLEIIFNTNSSSSTDCNAIWCYL